MNRNDRFHLGGFVELLNIPNFSILTQLSYVRKGGEWIFGMINYKEPQLFTVTERLDLDYLSLAALGKIRLTDFMVSPYLIAGPRLEILVGQKQEQGNTLMVFHERSADIVGGLTIGGGAQLARIASMAMILEFRYNIDLNSAHYAVWPEPIEGFHYMQAEFKNESFDISLGVGF